MFAARFGRSSHTAAGFGNMRFYNGDNFEGEWLNDRRHGQGTFIHADGSRYDGEWASGRKEVRAPRRDVFRRDPIALLIDLWSALLIAL